MANTALLDRIKKNSTLGGLKTLDKSPYLQNQDNILTEMPVLNIAFSGELDKGFRSGLIQFAGPSKHFKTNLALVAVKAFFDKYPDAICLFFDSEFGITNDYLAAQGIDPTQVIHIPVMNIEELRFEIVNQLEGLTRDDKVIILIDSIGNLASKKEVEDSKNENGAQDMSRPKMLKSLGRIVTPYLTTKDIPCIAINHVYDSLNGYTKTVSGGTGLYLSANTIFIISRAQEKDGTEITGWTFTLNIEKSRDVRERSKVKFQVDYEKGIMLYSGLLDIAMATGHVIKPGAGWYCRVINGVQEDKKYRQKDTQNKEFWDPILKEDSFKNSVKKIFKLSSDKRINELDDDVDLNENIDDDE